jgi:hypothetical protein
VLLKANDGPTPAASFKATSLNIVTPVYPAGIRVTVKMRAVKMGLPQMYMKDAVQKHKI